MNSRFILILLFTSFFVSNSFSATYYWKGGAGNWSDTTHWSLTPGGADAAIIPTTTDNVNFGLLSGLGLGDIVYMDVPVHVVNFTYQFAPNGFTFDGSIASLQIDGNFTTNGNATFVWPVDFNFNPIASSTIKSSGIAWTHNFFFNGPTISKLSDDLNTTKNITLLSGTLDLNNNDLDCFDVFSPGAVTRILDMSGSIVTVLGTIWDFAGTNQSITSTASTLNFTNVGSLTFNGGNQSYSTVAFNSSAIAITDNNGFNSFNLLTNPVVTLANSSTQDINNFSSIGTCSAPTLINTPLSTGPSASIHYSGVTTFTASNLSINNVDAVNPPINGYSISLSDTTNGADGWIFGGSTYYWIGGTGNWTDPAHWSFTSNGVTSVCIPGKEDNVVFDANSFSAAGQIVTVNNSLVEFKTMTWATATNNPKLSMANNLFAYGNITLNAGLTIDTLTGAPKRIEIRALSQLNPLNAYIKCNISINTKNNTDAVTLASTLNMASNRNLFLGKGEFNSNGKMIKAGAIITSIFDTLNDVRKLNISNSLVELAEGFYAKNETTNFTFISTNSHLKIIDTSGLKVNYLKTEGLTFHDVTFDVKASSTNPYVSPQRITGNNTFNKFIVMKKSGLVFDSLSVQTIMDSLIMLGTCKDSIYLKSSSLTVAAKIGKATNTNIKAECIALKGITASALPITLLYSEDFGGNTNFVFSTATATTSSFTTVGPFCLNDTTLFTNTSTAVSGNVNDIIESKWFYNDGSTGYFQQFTIVTDTATFTDSTYITYEIDTNQHKFIAGGVIPVTLVTTYTNFCTDTVTNNVTIYDPSFQLSTTQPDTTICNGELVTFTANSSDTNIMYEFFLNGNSLNTPSLTDTIYVTDSIVQNDIISAIGYNHTCPSSDTVNFFEYVVHDLPIITWSSNDLDTTICAGQQVNFTATSGDSTDAFRYYKNYFGTTSFIDSASFWSTSGILNNDTISVVGKSQYGCYDTLSMIFTVNPLPPTTLAASIPNGVICTGDQVDFTASGATTYEFFVANVSQGLASTASTFSSTSLTTGQVVKVVGYNPTGCFKASTQTFSYTVNPLPVISFSSSDADTSICSGTSVDFSASGASLYEFFVNNVSQGAASSFATFSAATLTNNDQIYVEGEFSGCSASSGIMTFEVLASPTTSLISNDADQSICATTPVLFTAGGATNYEYFINGSSQGAPSTTTTFSSSTLSNNQTVTVNGESNGCIVSQSLTFTVLSVPTVNIFSNDGDNTICEGQSITFTGTSAAQYQLFVNNASVGLPQASPTFTPTLPNGTNTVYIIGTAPNGCKDTSSVLSPVNVIALPTVNVTSSDADNIICAGTSVTFSGTGSSQYQFFLNGSPIGAMSSTSQFTTSSLTNGQTVYIIGSTSGCTNTSTSIATTVNPSPTVTLLSSDVDNVFCEDETVNYTAGGATNYQFFVNGVSQGASSTTNTLSSTGFGLGTYTVQVIGEASACTNSISKTITVNAVPSAAITSSDIDNILCQGETVTFTGTGGNLYSFNINGTAQNSPSPASTYTINSINDNDVVSVNTFSASGCTNTSTGITFTVNPIPTITFNSSDADQTICIGDNVDFTASGASTYEFFVNNVSQGAPSATALFSTTSLANGTSISVNGSSSGCSANATPFTFTVYQYPVVSLVNNGESQICTSENTNLQASGANNYQFSVNGNPVGGFTASPAFNSPVTNGDIISVTGETNGCAALSTNTISLTVYNYPTLTSTSSDLDNIICINDTIDFNASGAMTYTFAVNGNDVQNNAATIYTNHTLENGDLVSITGYNGDCPSTDDTYTFTVNSMNLGIAVANSTLVCPGENVTFTATGGNEYEFFVNTISTGAMSTTNTYSSNALVNLDQIDVYAYSSATGCYQWLQDFVIMNVIDEPTITENSSLDFCEGDSVILYSNAPYGNQWYLNGNPISGAIDTSYVAYTSGLYTLETTAGGTGNVWSIGQNATGSFGDGTNFNSISPSDAITTETITEIAGGLEFVLAKTAAGTVLSWGKNSSGQLGLGTYTPHNTPQLVPVITNAKTIATSEASSMVVTNAGAVYVWGNNTVGQLGTGNTSVINFPYLNASLTNVDSIAGGKTHFVILKNDGTVWTVGSNSYGQLGQGNLTPSMTPVQIASLSNIVSVGAGEYHSFAINNTGDVYAWGNNGSGQLGLGDLNNRLIPTLVPLKNVVNAQGGANHSAFLTSSKKVYTSGGNAYGQLGVGNTTSSTSLKETNLQSVTMISTGQYTTMALRSDKSTFGFGNNSENQLLASGSIITSPQQIPALAGVGFIESNNLASHFIFEENHACVSAASNVNMLTAPSVIITESNDVLTASETGVSYQWFYETNPAVLGTNQSFSTANPGIYFVVVTFANGCTSKSELYYHHVIGIDEKAEIEFALYPNPVNNELTITWTGYSGELNLEVYDQTGRIITQENAIGLSSYKLPTSELQNGVYWLKVTTDTGDKTYKFIKAN